MAVELTQISDITGPQGEPSAVQVRTSDGQVIPEGLAVVLTLDKTLAQILVDPVATVSTMVLIEL